MTFPILIATWFGSGNIKPASGTWGTLAGLPLIIAVIYYSGVWGVIIGSLVLFCIGIWAAHRYEIMTGEHDSGRIVIDEVCGMMIAATPLLFHFSWVTVIACFIGFRIFDAWKIGLVGWMDRGVNGALGVMVDDVVAGLLTAIIVMGGLLWLI